MSSRIHLPKHLAFIRTLPCLVCLNDISSEAAHIRYSSAKFCKVNPGQRKPHDFWTIPLCGYDHRKQHGQNEEWYWRGIGIDPLPIALALYAHSGNYLQCEKIIRAQH